MSPPYFCSLTVNVSVGDLEVYAEDRALACDCGVLQMAGSNRPSRWPSRERYAKTATRRRAASVATRLETGIYRIARFEAPRSMVAVRKNEDVTVVFSSGASLAQGYHRSLRESFHRSAPTTPPSGFGRRVITSKCVRELADIPRAAGLRDITVEVSVAHTKSKLKARFFVEMKREKTMPRQNWGFGASLLDIRKFELQMSQLVKKHYRANRQGERNGVKKCCAMCIQLREEMRAWSAVKRWSAMNPAHKERKCDTINLFFDKLFDMLSRQAQWIHECEALRDILRSTEELTKMQYPHDADAVDVIRSLRRVDINNGEYGQLDTSCTICMSKIDRFPEESADRGRVCAVELPCGHRFHDTCICMWLHARLDCPVCRGHLSAPVSSLSTSSFSSSRRL